MKLKRGVIEISESLCGALSDLGCIYEVFFDNRGGKRSRYIYVRKPVAAKIRISDHRSERVEKEQTRSRKMLVLDVRVGDSLSYDNALAAIQATV